MFLRGYVQVIVKSHFIERFINICIRRDHLSLGHPAAQRVGEADMKMSMRSFQKLRPIAKKTLARVHKENTDCQWFCTGIKRYFFVGGLIAAVSLSLMMSQFVWSIEVVGNEVVSTQEILQVWNGLGVHRGRLPRRYRRARPGKQCALRARPA